MGELNHHEVTTYYSGNQRKNNSAEENFGHSVHNRITPSLLILARFLETSL
jgi:hypothetical protein